MTRLPLGISQFDSMIGGGVPAGSVVLLAGEPGAGAREFGYTSAVVNGLASVDDDLFDLYYGDVADAAEVVPEVHYLSFTQEPAALVEEMRFVMADELVDAGVDAVTLVDFSKEYFQLTPVPTEWYADRTADITELGNDQERGEILTALGEYLSVAAPGNLVVVDSVTDLLAVEHERITPAMVSVLVKGLSRAAYQWGGTILLLASVEPLSETVLGRLKDASDGTLLFQWESGGSERARTLVVESFRGVLSRLEDENIVRFETEIHDAGFDISNVRKIR